MTYSNKHNRKLRRLCLLLALLLGVWGSVSVFAENSEDPLEEHQVGESSEQEPEAEQTATPSLTEIIQGKLDTINGLQDFTDRINEIKNRQPTTPEEVAGLQNDAEILRNDIQSEISKISLPSLFDLDYSEWAAASEEEWKLPEGWDRFTREAWSQLDQTAQQGLIEKIGELTRNSNEKKPALDASLKDIEAFLNNEVRNMRTEARLNDHESRISHLENPPSSTTPEETATPFLDTDTIRFYCLLAAFALNLGLGICALVKASKKPPKPEINLKDFAKKSSVTSLSNTLSKLEETCTTLSKANAALKDEFEKHKNESEKPEIPSKGSEEKKKVVHTSSESSASLPDIGRPTGRKLRLIYNPVSNATCYFTPQTNGEYELTDKNYIRFCQRNTGTSGLRGWKDTGLFFVYDAEIDGRRYAETEVSQISGYFTIGSVKTYPTVRARSDGNYSLDAKGLLEMKHC